MKTMYDMLSRKLHVQITVNIIIADGLPNGGKRRMMQSRIQVTIVISRYSIASIIIIMVAFDDLHDTFKICNNLSWYFRFKPALLYSFE